MALINCTNCEKPVSDRAMFCPHCGASICAEPKYQEHQEVQEQQEEIYVPDYDESDYKDKKNPKSWIAGLIGLFIVALAIGGWLYYDNVQTQKRIAEEQYRADSIAAVQTQLEAEQHRRDSINAAILAAEQARQDSIAKWDFYTAEEIFSIANFVQSASAFRTFCQRHHLAHEA